MKKLIPFFLLSILLLSACADNTENNPITTENPPETITTTKPETTNTPTENKATFTMEQLAEHNTPESCWLLIDGKIYDVTGFSDKHAGGEAILLGCGIDATSLFESRPETGEPHSEKARGFLPNFYIGDLAQ